MASEFQDAFLDELLRLDAYLADIGGSGEDVPSAADPEVRRLLEAVAFFSARTQQMAYRGMFDAVSALAAEHCDFLRHPLGACGLVRALDAGGWSSAVTLPQGTPLLVEAADGAAVQLATSVSAVLAPVRVFAARLEVGDDARWLVLGVEAPVRLAQLGWLSLHVDLLGDLARSIGLHRRLRVACRSARYLGGGPGLSGAPDPGSPAAFRGRPRLEVRFGARVGAPGDHAPPALEAVRRHLQLPQRDLFINIELPADGRDTRAWLALELDPACGDVSFTAQTFQPNVLPVENAIRAPADPIVDDGRAGWQPIVPPAELAAPRYANVGTPFELGQIERVSELDDELETTLFATALGEPERSYRLEWRTVRGRERPHLALPVPGSPTRPRRVRVDAVWTQPGLDLAALGRTRVRPWRLGLPDVAWKLLEGTAPFHPSPLEGAPAQLMELLAWTTRQTPTRDELVRLLLLLGASAAPTWRKLAETIESVSWRELPDGASEGATDGTRLEVALECRTPEEEQEPLLDDLVDRIEVFLNAWCDAPVRVRARRGVRRAPLRLVGAGS